ncbi:lipoyl synthase [Thermocrinis minervae]|uniref:Lipoyl synthase n=1 Tax=Thermocrinis minervae TaxID=381751 RepID=A0A1M6QP72_9AQUI|nr:lipoyl synthase [Thermocrinis minervae]SHK22061.1 lipoic acid synthetase [Thermocrinis minervae]
MKPKVKAPSSEITGHVINILKKYSLNTVCEESLCPNISECFSMGHATFLILGKVCTRACKFCHVATGRPYPPDPSEPYRLFLAVKELGLEYVVITSVDRDDLQDYGASHFKRCVDFLKSRLEVYVEVLTPDFMGDVNALHTVASSRADILSHNIETVRRLHRLIRPKGDYDRSLEVLRFYSTYGKPVKSAIMLGLGETRDDLLWTFEDLRKVGVEHLVIGQYLRPSYKQMPVVKHYMLEEFKEIEECARSFGFKEIFAHPLARSSYVRGLK